MPQFFKIIFITIALLFSVGIMDSCKSRGPYNPYLKMKVKPNKKQMDADKIIIKKGNKAYLKQLRKNRRHFWVVGQMRRHG